MSDARARAERLYSDMVREYQSAILNYVWRLVGDREVAEDLTQETYVKAWRALERMELDDAGDARRRAWLYRIANNCATDHLRRRARLRWLPLESARGRGSSGPENRVAQREPLELALASLSEDHRRALLLFCREGLRADEVAEVLGISPAAARKRLQRSRAAFAAAYGRLAAEAEQADDKEFQDRVGKRIGSEPDRADQSGDSGASISSEATAKAVFNDVRGLGEDRT